MSLEQVEESSIETSLKELIELEQGRMEQEKLLAQEKAEFEKAARLAEEKARVEEEAKKLREALAVEQASQTPEPVRESIPELEARVRAEVEAQAQMRNSERVLAHQEEIESIRATQKKGVSPLTIVAVILLAVGGALAAYFAVLKPWMVEKQQAELTIMEARERAQRAERDAITAKTEAKAAEQAAVELKQKKVLAARQAQAAEREMSVKERAKNKRLERQRQRREAAKTDLKVDILDGMVAK